MPDAISPFLLVFNEKHAYYGCKMAILWAIGARLITLTVAV
jgi:hypothetical protein